VPARLGGAFRLAGRRNAELTRLDQFQPRGQSFPLCIQRIGIAGKLSPHRAQRKQPPFDTFQISAIDRHPLQPRNRAFGLAHFDHRTLDRLAHCFRRCWQRACPTFKSR
jgi:hypothetical protein